MIERLGAGLFLFLALSACSFLPSGAPTASEFAGGDVDPGFLQVALDPQIARMLSIYRKAGLASTFSGSYQPTLMLRPGDTISTTIYEVTPVPLFGPATTMSTENQNLPVGGHTATIPTQVIDLDGSVPVPFAGRVKVAGLTPSQAAIKIEEALKGKATNAQAVVTLVTSVVNSATVNGDVGRPALIPLTARGERVLDVIAAAGGAKFPPFDSDVELLRAGHVAKTNLQQIVDDPRENLAMRPGDSLYVIHNPRSFTVLGSALKVAQYDFGTERVTLAEAIGRSGGLNDTISNVGVVYLLRFEPRDMVHRLVAIVEPYRLDPARYDAASTMPVAYRLDLRQATGYFVSQLVQMRDKDVVLMTNADSVQFSKLLYILRSISGIYYDLKGAGGNNSNTASTTKTD